MKESHFRKPIMLPLILIALFTITLSACLQTPEDASDQPIPLDNSDNYQDIENGSSESGNEAAPFAFNLSEGQAQPDVQETVLLAAGNPLSDQEITAILSRLTALSPMPEDQLDFYLSDELLPPPLTGDSIDEPFPPSLQIEPDDVNVRPLEVLRYAPEGEIPIAPFVSITFNQPMVPLTSLHDISTTEVPVKIEPALTGTWRWLGTKTLTFQYDSDLVDRMPMATIYQVIIPSGIQSASGSKLAESVQFSFSTPPPTVVNTYPANEPQPLEPTFFISFDQRINPRSVLNHIDVTAEGHPVEIKLATEDQIAANKDLSTLISNTNEGRWLAFRAQSPLPADSSIYINIGSGIPSAEGPLVSKNAQSYNFYTYAPLEIIEHDCSWHDDQCRPLMPFNIEFNNPIDASTYDESMLQITPDLPGATVNIFGNHIQISGASKGQTTYRITIDGAIRDIFGQTLGKTKQIKFKVGTSEPYLVGPDEKFITLDPSSKQPALSLYTINYNKLDVKIYAVQPSDWPEFMTYLEQYQRTDKAIEPPGALVRDEVQNLEIATDELTEINIEFANLIDNNYGHFIIIAKPHRTIFEDEKYWETIQTWVQVTQIGLDVITDHTEMIVWASNLNDGSPISGASITSDNDSINATTDQDGTAKFDLPASRASYILASVASDLVMLPRSTYFWDEGGWYKRPVTDALRWFVFDDRQMYRPGEEVHIKGWLRNIGGGQTGDISLVGESVAAVNYQLFGPQGNELSTGSIAVNALGGFDFMLSLPENANLGYAQLQFTADSSLSKLSGTHHTHIFQIQEFRRPEFEVSARNESTGPYFAGDHAVVAVKAKYFAGGPLPGAETTWWVTSSPTNYHPPNWPDFNFGTWIPWWSYSQSDYQESGGTSYIGKTDAGGTHFLNLDFPAKGQSRPISIIAEATVMDLNRQAWSSKTSLMVHPADLYIGLRSQSYFVERGTPLEIEIIVTDLDGNLVPDRPITVEASRLQWTSKGGWHEEEVETQTCQTGSTSKPVACTFKTPIGGTYQITGIIADGKGRSNQTQFTRWVSGGQMRPSREVEQESLNLIPDKETYRPGETAQILIQSPFLPAEGMLTVSRSGILYTDRFTISEGSHTLQIPIEDAHTPNIQIQVDIVGSAPRTDDTGQIVKNTPPRPAYAIGQLNLSIPPLERTLSLETVLRDLEIGPGEETTLSINLKDALGHPVSNAELAVIVVDEAILALTNYQLSNPLDSFYTQRSSELSSVYGRSSIILSDPQAFSDAARSGSELTLQSADSLDKNMVGAEALMEMPAAAPEMEMMEGDNAGLGSSGNPIRIRSDFNPLATFAAEVNTDSNGRAAVEIKLPDNLTRYRVMVVAVDSSGKQFGLAEANLTARLPLMVRPSAPRFLNFGDQFELPVMLQNQTDQAMDVDIVIQASNIKLTDFAGLNVTVPPNDRIEVRFPATTEMAGTARFQIAAVSGSISDAAAVELPVYTPATTEAFATYGTVDNGAIKQPLLPPTAVFPQFGGLEISTSSTALQALTDAVLYLSSYPYECTEQLSSRILGIAALRDVLTAFEAEGLPAPEALEAAVQRDIERLSGIQNWDGGFPYWRSGQDSIPFNTIHVAHALQRAKFKGFDIPESMQQQLLHYLVDIENHYPHWYSIRTRQTLSAYALYVRTLMGDRDTSKARSFLTDTSLEKLSLDTIGWIWQVFVDDPTSKDELDNIRLYINNHAVETAGSANFTIGYDDQSYLLLSSNRRTDAILLDALIADKPQHDLIPKLVNGLMAHRTKGHWGNTQENVFVLLALDRYFNTFEAQTPDFVAKFWLGNTFAGEHKYQGYTTERHQTNIPMSYIINAADPKDLIISKNGVGRLYYRLGLSYAPVDLNLESLDMGFVVQRTYEAIDAPEDVYQDNDGAWHIKAGSRVRVRLTMVADNRRYHVALVDPLPAGLEIINPTLFVSGNIPQDPDSTDYRYGWWWWSTWYQHQNMRDERAEAFTPLLWDGVYEYTYTARATTPGTFIAPPAKAEEMYSPEVFGRSSSDWIVVE